MIDATKITSGTRVLYAHGTKQEYWLEKREQHENTNERMKKRRPWVTTYVLIASDGTRETTTNPEDLTPATMNYDPTHNVFTSPSNDDRPSAIRFLHRAQKERYPDNTKQGDQVTWMEDPNENPEGTPANDTYTVTGITTWVDESDESPIYGFWVVDIENNRTKQTKQVCDDELAPVKETAKTTKTKGGTTK